MRSRLKYIISFLALFLFFTFPALAGEPKPEPVFNNPLAVALIVLMILLLIIISVLANILIGVAGIKLKEKRSGNTPLAVVVTALLLLSSSSVFAQQDQPGIAEKAALSFGGLSATAFYLMMTILFIESLVILVLLMNIRLLVRKEKKAVLLAEADITKTIEERRNRLSWWDRFNKLRPVSQEAELDLGHEYDGIRELNNRLPPWWLYGFYITIIFAVVYLWRFHVSHDGPSSQQEYEKSVISADLRVQEYLKKKGESVDENTVTMLTGMDDLSAGQSIFADPSKCAACHGADGGGTIGPNLTDNYWLYGGSLKDMFKTVKYGTNKGMRSWKDDLSPKQMAQVVSYISSLKGTKPAKPKEPQGELYIGTEPPVKPAADSSKMTAVSPK